MSQANGLCNTSTGVGPECGPRALYEAYQDRDWARPATFLHPHVAVEMPAAAERLEGRDAVIEFQRSDPEPWGVLAVRRVLADPDLAAAEVTVLSSNCPCFRATNSGRHSRRKHRRQLGISPVQSQVHRLDVAGTAMAPAWAAGMERSGPGPEWRSGRVAGLRGASDGLEIAEYVLFGFLPTPGQPPRREPV